MPTNVPPDRIRRRDGLAWGIPAMLIGVIYFYAAAICTTLIDRVDEIDRPWSYNIMVVELHGYTQPRPERLNAVFAALADPTRRAILARLASGEASVMELVEPFPMSQPAISKHIKVLERAGLVTRGRDAQRRPVRIDVRVLAEATDWLEGYRKLWERNFQRLDTLLDELKSEPRPEQRNAAAPGGLE